MALINKWPQNEESFYDNKQWEAKSWTIGEPITKEKLQNLDDGIAVLATQMKAILGEFNPSSLDGAQLNASRLDDIQKWITAAEDGKYDFTKGSIAARLNSIDTLNSAQNTRLTNIETVNTAQSTDISSLKTRATNLENRATAIETLNTTQNGRLDSIESKNTEQDGRLDSIETLNTQQNNKLAAIISEIGGTGNDGTNTTYSGTSRIDNLNKWITGNNNGEGTYSGTAIATRLSDLEKEICGSTITRDTTNGGYSNSKIDNIETTNSKQERALTAIKNELGGAFSDNGTTASFNNSYLKQILNEVYDANTPTNPSFIDSLKGELGVSGTRTTNGWAASKLQTAINDIEKNNKKISAIANELGGGTPDGNSTTYPTAATRLDDLEKEIGGTRDAGNGYTNSKIRTLESTTSTHTTEIDSLEQKVGNGVIGTDSDISAAIRRLSDTVAGLDPTGSAEAIGFLVSEVWGQTFSEDTDFTANSRIDNLETTTQNLGTTTQNLGTQLSTLATGQEELEQNLAVTNTKIPIEMYIATNSSASDTIILNAAPRDKSIFFIAIPQGTLGTNNLTLQTPDIQFNNILINRIYNGNGMKIKYSAGSLISIYRNGANAYAYNVPMVL